jgi:RNA polymerase sigma-32 factor
MRVNTKRHFDLRRCAPMARDEEHRCAIEYVKTRDPALAHRLVVANMRLVVSLARHYCRSDDDLDDIVQEGNWGLLRAVEKYDPTRGIKFCSYAVWWIRAYMLKFTMDNWRLVKVGTTLAQRKLFFGLRKGRDELERAGTEVSPATLAKRLRVKESELVEMSAHFAGAEVSLDAPVKSTGAPVRTVGDLLRDASARGPDERVENAEFIRLLQSKLKVFGATLDSREAQLFRHRLMADDPLSMREMASRFGVTRERTRQVEEQLKHKIRDYLQDEMGDALEPPSISDANVGTPRFARPMILTASDN